MTHVAVLMGGWSAERQVSLTSGNAIADALERLGHRVTRIDMDRDVARVLLETAPDVVFNALHGTPGEDGTVQGMLDLMGIPYTHSSLATSAIAIDKQLTKLVLTAAGIRMPEGRIVQSRSLYDADPMPRPYVLKPVNEGSSVGVAIVTDESNYGSPIAPRAEGPWQRYDELLAERYIPGRELTVAVIDGEALAVTELAPTRGFYDYDAKYTSGLTTHECPARIPVDVERTALEMAVRAHEVLGCRGASRSDFRYDESEGADGVYLLEVNTQPGMTPLSLVPEQAAFRGMSFDELVGRMLASALSAAEVPA
jgi:D-alanine-D-alanine ligase